MRNSVVAVHNETRGLLKMETDNTVDTTVEGFFHGKVRMTFNVSVMLLVHCDVLHVCFYFLFQPEGRLKLISAFVT